MIEISVIIPTYKSIYLNECLYGIFNSDFQSYEVIVIDDFSPGNYLENIPAESCEIIRLNEHLGPARARNIGVKAAKGDILCFIDSDVKIFKDTLSLIYRSFKLSPQIAAVQTVNTEHCRFINFASQYQNLYNYFNTQLIKYKYIAAISGHCFAVKKASFVMSGGFDESIRRPSVEDGNLGMKLHINKNKIYLNKNIRVEHISCVSLKTVLGKMFIRSSDKTFTLLKNKSLLKINPNKTEHSIKKICSSMISPVFLFALIGSILSLPNFLTVAVLTSVIYILCSSGFFYFVLTSNGAVFALKTFFFHYIYCLVGSMGVIYGIIRFLLSKRKCA